MGRVSRSYPHSLSFVLYPFFHGHFFRMTQIGCLVIKREVRLGSNFCYFLVKQEIEAMDADDILARQVEQLDKEKRELQTRLKTQEKKVNTLGAPLKSINQKQSYQSFHVWPTCFTNPLEKQRLLNVFQPRINLTVEVLNQDWSEPC